MPENEFRERIIQNLRVHPEGLTIFSLAEFTGISRFTISKYVMVMVAEGLINQRPIGTAKLCYLKGEENEENN
jgi:DNA-binding IclR family transcriptional regulator